MDKLLKSLFLLLLFCGFASAQNKEQFKVSGLEITAPLKLDGSQASAKIEAKSQGQVKWLVIADKNIKYEEDIKNKSLIFKDLNSASVVNIFAVANVENKLTDFAYTKITLKNDKTNQKITAEKPEVTIFIDYKSLTPEQNSIINLPFVNQKYNYINFKTFDAKFAKKEYNDFPSGLLIIKVDEKEVYFGPLPKDLKTYTDILNTLAAKGK